MSKIVTVIFDGQVLRPEQPLDLPANARYVVTIEEAAATRPAQRDAWDVLAGLSGTVDALPNWSVEHDHYLYGTPKQAPKPTP